MAATRLVVVFLVALGSVSGYYNFRAKIPNAAIVPHPCKTNYMWPGVGHENPDGGGTRNPFGQDFNNAGKQWTKELCEMDSDGDGMTNGQELGDPNCVWTEGARAEVLTGITHPGVCNPYGQGVCAGKDSFVDCELETFGESCDVIQRPEVKTVDLKFQEHTIPNTETNYYCQYFQLPSDQDYHIVADEALLDNHQVCHHMSVYGCKDSYTPKAEDFEPHPCFMASEDAHCSQDIAGWTVGLSGSCHGEKYGYPFGANGFKYAKVEIHYNNPELATDYKDKSGMRLYYRPKMDGVKDLTTLTLGQTLFSIPPGERSVTVSGTCPSECSGMLFTTPLYVVSASHHMHYLGRTQKTVVMRNGTEIAVLAYDEHFRYDSPVDHDWKEPFELLPGDELKTTCTFDSSSKDHSVFYGDGTSDEMCFAFLTVYPASSLPYSGWCGMFGPITGCEWIMELPKHGCDWIQFTNMSHPDTVTMFNNLAKRCSLGGVCRPECRELVADILKHPCMGEKMIELVSAILTESAEGKELLGRLYSCGAHLALPEICEGHCQNACDRIADGDGDFNGRDVAMVTTPNLVALLVPTIIVAIFANKF